MSVEAPARDITGIVVSHTHWDREWYLTFQRFRMMLVDTVDLLLDILDNEPSFKFFTLDGQTIVLEDYLEIRPENEDRLARHIAEGRLMIGPWYVLPDEFLVSAESLLRNLLLGHRMASKYGKAMPVGYLPDTFGHPAQMPQILQGFGLDNAVIFRGVAPSSSEFIWEAPDGSQVLTIFLPGGYCCAMSMTTAPSRFLDIRLPEISSLLRGMATTSNMLVMNGCDHLPPRRNLAEVIEEANRRLENEGVHLRQGTLAEYVGRIKATMPRLETARGEFRMPRPGRVTPGVISARMYLKQENARTCTLLERYAEPLAAFAWTLGEIYPRSFLWQAWKYLMQNHPHDSICGCSIDTVHQDMMGRFRWAQEIGNEIVQRSLASIASKITLSGDDSVGSIVVFNPLARRHTGVVQHKLDFLEPDVEFHLTDETGRVLPLQVIGRKPIDLRYDPLFRRVQVEGKQRPTLLGISRSSITEITEGADWPVWRGEEVEVLYEAAEVPACGYTVLKVAEGAAPVQPRTNIKTGRNWMENAFVKVMALTSGAIELEDKRSGTVYSPIGIFEHRGDVGDEYTYCPPAEDKVLTSLAGLAVVRVIEHGPVTATIEIKQVMQVPKRIDEDRRKRSDEEVQLRIVTTVSIASESPAVTFRTEVDNHAEDAMLRVLFPTPIHTSWSHSQGQFEITMRPVGVDKAVLERPVGPDEEQAVNTFPHKAFVDVNDGERGLAVFNNGLPEFEVIPGDGGVTVALTLLRSVGYLSRPDLATRYGNAGPSLPTPEAQCQGRHKFEYGLVAHGGDWQSAAVHQEIDAVVAPMVAVHQGIAGGKLPTELGFVSIEPASLLLSAVKKAEDEEAVIVRFFNTSLAEVTARVSFGWPVENVGIVNMAEQAVEAQALSLRRDGSVEFPVRGAQIVTIKVV